MSEPKQQTGFNLQLIIMILSVLTSLIFIAGTFFTIGEFKGMMSEKVTNIEKSVQSMSADHELRLRQMEKEIQKSKITQ